jgi:hypothetical protein
MKINICKTLILLFFNFILSFCNERHPKLPKNVSANAHWIGGSDGGYWILVNRIINDSTFNADIYIEDSGELLIESDYTCSNPQIKLTKIPANEIYDKFVFVSEFKIKYKENEKSIIFEKK